MRRDRLAGPMVGGLAPPALACVLREMRRTHRARQADPGARQPEERPQMQPARAWWLTACRVMGSDPDSCEQGAKVDRAHRIDHLGCDLRQRPEHERALAKPRMRHDEIGRVDDAIAVENQIEIERARRAKARARAAAGVFEDLQRVMEILGRQFVVPTTAALRYGGCASGTSTGAVSMKGDARTILEQRARVARRPSRGGARRSPRLEPSAIATATRATGRPGRRRRYPAGRAVRAAAEQVVAAGDHLIEEALLLERLAEDDVASCCGAARW